MAQLTKKIKILEKETKNWKQRYDKSNGALIELIEEKKITEINKTINTLLFQNGFLFINIRTKNQSVNYKIIKS